MSFFITSQGRGFGGNLGGVAGADAICRLRATAVGRGDRTWRAYLSAPASGDAPAVHARDRIGRGPWVNARGVQIAANVEDLHSGAVNLTRDTALTETGAEVGPTRHDILTGSNADGTLSGNRRCDVPRLDQPCRRPRDGGTSQPQWRRARRLLERRPSVARLLAGRAARLARRRTVLLLRRRLARDLGHWKMRRSGNAQQIAAGGGCPAGGDRAAGLRPIIPFPPSSTRTSRSRWTARS